MKCLIKRQTGLTLVELMVATTLSLVLLAGVLLVFSANKTTYRLQNGLGTLQENGRYAMRQITADLQMAGFGGCLSTHLNPKPRVINLVSGSQPILDDFANGVFLAGRNDETAGFQYGGITMYDGPDHDQDGNPDGTDSIEIRGPLRSGLRYVAGEVAASGTIEVKGSVIGSAPLPHFIISDCAGADIFNANSFTASGVNTLIAHASGNKQASLSRGFNADAVVTEFARHTYFVHDTGRTNASGDPVIALYRFDGTNPAVELVDGVEDLQVEYALDTTGNGKIDAFRDAGAIGAADWAGIMAIRVSLLLNSVEDSSAVLAPYTYFPAGSVQITPPAGDLRLRQEFSSLVFVRNAVQ